MARLFLFAAPLVQNRVTDGAPRMTPSQQWILGLFVVYSIPAFLFGVGLTLAVVRRRRTATAMLPGLLSPDRTFEGHDVTQPDTAPHPGPGVAGLRITVKSFSRSSAWL